MSLRFPISRRKSPSAIGLRQILPVQTKRTFFTVTPRLRTRAQNRFEREEGQSCSRRETRYNPRVRSIWKNFRYRLEWISLWLATKLIPLLSRQACYRLALTVGGLMSILDRHGRKVALSNLEVAFGDQFT